jgi:DUF4097 and DUF4098 domain-containing protein YvlB
MKKILWFLVAAGSLTVMTGCNVHVPQSWPDADLKAVTNVIQTAAIPAGVKGLEVDNWYGSVHVIGTDNGTNAWTWQFTVRAKSDAVAQKIASGASCKVEQNGDELDLVVSLPVPPEPHSIQSDFEISVPKTVSIRTQNRFGPTHISDLTGNVEATDENGRLEIQNIAGSVNAQTSFGSLSVSHTGSARLKDQNGRIEAEAIGGPLDAQTSFATLVARNVRGAATLHDQNGQIEATAIDGPLDAGTSFASLIASDISGAAHLRDQNGSIKINKVGGDVDIETSFATLRVEEIGGNAILMNQNGSVVASGVNGSVKATTSFAAMDISGGGSKFVCHNQNGSIRLHPTSVALTNIQAQTSFATLEVRLPVGLKPAIQARTTFADVESDFPVLLKPRGEDPFADVTPDTAQISLENQNGKIRVVRD